VSQGEEKAKQWLEGIKRIIPRYIPRMAIVEALSRGEIAVGFVNHYYLESSSKKIQRACGSPLYK